MRIHQYDFLGTVDWHGLQIPVSRCVWCDDQKTLYPDELRDTPLSLARCPKGKPLGLWGTLKAHLIALGVDCVYYRGGKEAT